MEIDVRRVDPSVNMNRFYSVELTKDLFGHIGVHRQWGRFGTWGRIGMTGSRLKPKQNMPYPIWSNKN